VKEKQWKNVSMKMSLGCVCFVLHETLFLQVNSKLLGLTWQSIDQRQASMMMGDGLAG
jgi:hypothetical protein